MSTPEFHFHPPKRTLRALERARLREVRPADIVLPDELNELFTRFPDLAGDRDIGRSDSDGRCQSWRGDRGWWRRFIEEQNGTSLQKH